MDSTNNFEGIIQSPNYGYNYFPNLDCTWILNATSEFDLSLKNESSNLNESLELQYRQNLMLMEDKKILIEFIDFDVSDTPLKISMRISQLFRKSLNCQSDYVQV